MEMSPCNTLRSSIQLSTKVGEPLGIDMRLEVRVESRRKEPSALRTTNMSILRSCSEIWLTKLLHELLCSRRYRDVPVWVEESAAYRQLQSSSTF